MSSSRPSPRRRREARGDQSWRAARIPMRNGRRARKARHRHAGRRADVRPIRSVGLTVSGQHRAALLAGWTALDTYGGPGSGGHDDAGISVSRFWAGRSRPSTATAGPEPGSGRTGRADQMPWPAARSRPSWGRSLGHVLMPAGSKSRNDSLQTVIRPPFCGRSWPIRSSDADTLLGALDPDIESLDLIQLLVDG